MTGGTLYLIPGNPDFGEHTLEPFMWNNIYLSSYHITHAHNISIFGIYPIA